MKFKFLKQSATLGFVGYLPASGTMASLLTLGMYAAIINFFPHSSLVAWYFFKATFLVGLFIILSYALPFFKTHDPSCVVLDEVIGMITALTALEPSFLTFSLALVFFRFFDIVKPWPINLLERLPGALGVVADDLGAAACANGLTQAIVGLLGWLKNYYA